MIKFNSNYLNSLVRNSSYVAFNKICFKNFYFQDKNRHGAGDCHIVAKRVINVVGRTLREIDPNRWDGVPVTFETKWNDDDTPMIDVRTAVLIHDALEKEFNVDIDDKKILMGTVKEAVDFILEAHVAI